MENGFQPLMFKGRIVVKTETHDCFKSKYYKDLNLLLHKIYLKNFFFFPVRLFLVPRLRNESNNLITSIIT